MSEVCAASSNRLWEPYREHGPLFLAPLWLWCLTMWALAASTLSLSACWVVCICYGFSSSVEASVLYNFPSFCAAQSVESVRAKTSILAAALSLKQHHLSMYTESDDKLLFLHKHAVSKFFFSAWPALLEDDCYTTSSLQILLLVH